MKLQITHEADVSASICDLIANEVAKWPAGLEEILAANGVTLRIARTGEAAGVAFTEAEHQALGFYNPDSRVITMVEYHKDQDGVYKRIDDAELIAALNHEVGHAIAFNVCGKFPETENFKRLYGRDMRHYAQTCTDAFNALEPSLHSKMNYNNYHCSQQHESFAEVVSYVLSSNKGKTRLNEDIMPRCTAAVRHIFENIKNGLPPLENIDDYDIRTQILSKRSSTGLLVPAGGVQTVGTALAALEERISMQNAPSLALNA